jgi:DNA-binding MarR family transcriptional regulator
MADNATEAGGAQVIPLRPLTAAKASERKWGKAVMELGFCIVPSLLLRAQRRLGLNPTQLAVLMHLADYWWDVDRKPYPSKKTLGERLGLGPRQVQRYIAELEEAGLVKRIERRAAHRGKLTNEYDLSGLVKRLKELEPEFREVEEEIKSRRRAVARPGVRPRRPKAPD